MNRSVFDFFLHAALVLGAALGLLALLLVEAFEAYPIPLGYYLGFALVWTLLLLARLRLRLERKHWALLAAVLTVLTIVYVVPWHPRKPFLRAFFEVEPGMSEEAVRGIMAGYDLFQRGDLWIFDVPDDWLYDSDGARVRFVDGRVESKMFLPD